MVSAANRTMGRHGSVAGTEGPVPSANYDWGFPASRGEMVSEAARGDLDALVRLGGRDARAVTEHWRRSNRLCRCYARGRFVAEARDAWQKIACAGSWGPPALLAVRLRMLRKRHVLAAAGSSRGCPHKASIVGWPRNAASTLSAGWARRVTTNKWFQPKGAYSRMPVEGRRFPVA